ncbi:MAG: DUF4242 domain-containing protein [Saccharospirillaceae bacterium]|nr:DUF4242 domain-containing protein [Pseudomonadales bacterium]NRB77525.1 DUF4242 domain-containing protein [Saccharospirillaceae bacterium]
MLYLDIHHGLESMTLEAMYQAHLSDLDAQDKFGVKYLKYWFDETNQTVCCLIDAPNKGACDATHLAAHGSKSDKIIEVENDMLQAFFGNTSETTEGRVMTPDGSVDGGFRTIMFTDIVNSTALTQELGDEQSDILLQIHDKIIRAALHQFKGSEVKHTGDGIMASFVSASAAVKCASRIQSDMAFNENAKFEIRIGLSAGEPVSRNHDLFGATVQMAARVCDKAAGNQIFVANVVHQLCLGKGLNFVPKGVFNLKGFEDSIEIFEVLDDID